MSQRLIIVSLSSLLVLSGCNRWDEQTEIGKAVRVSTLPAGDTAGRYEATVESFAGKGYVDHMVALMNAASQRCPSSSFAITQGAAKFPEAEGKAPAGETLSLVAECQHDRLPNHEVLGPGETWSAFVGPLAPGLDQKMATIPLKQHHGSVRLASEALFGGFLRKAYTEDCAGKAVVVEYLGVSTDAPATSGTQAVDPSVGAVLRFRCMDREANASAPSE